MILHIALDDKFIDMAYNMFEKASPNNNEFMVVTKQDKFRYIKTTSITKVAPLKFLSKGFANSLTKYDFVVLHWLDDMKKQIIFNAPKEVKFIWIGWGGDYYSYINKNLFLPLTKNMFNSTLEIKSNLGIKKRIKSFIKEKIFLRDTENIKKIMDRIDYFAPVLEEDYYLVAKSFTRFYPKYIDWNYGTLEDDLIRGIDKIVSQDNILVGNSATMENNHLDAFDLLKRLDLENKKIICPLSYGDEKYAEIVIKKGDDLFGEKFNALTSFMTIDEYNKIISTCSVVIMNHLRQQAVGNIVIMMYFGAKIFLNKENPVYEFFKKNGAVIFSMDELNNININTKLFDEEVEQNRLVLKKYWSRNVMIEKTKSLIETMKSINV